MAAGLPSFFGLQQPVHEIALHEKNDQNRGDQGHHGHGHDQVPFRGLRTAGNGGGDSHDHDLHFVRAGGHEGPQVLVPTVDEHDHEESGHAGPGVGQEDGPEKTQRPGAVDLGRVHQLVGNGQVKLPKKEGRRGRSDEGDDQTHVGVHPSQFAHHLVGGDDPDGDREHEGHEDHPEEDLFPPEVEIDDGKGGKNGDGDLSQADRQGHDGAVEEKLAHVHPGPDLDVVLQEMGRGPELLGRHHDLFHALGAEDEGVVEGKADEEYGHEQEKVNERLGPFPLSFFSPRGG